MGCTLCTQNSNCCRWLYGYISNVCCRGYTEIGESGGKLKPDPVELGPVEPDTVKPGPVKPEPKPPVKPGPVKPPVEPGPVEPPVEPEPTKPEPKPPVEPGPVEPPVEPVPVEPEPTKPEPLISVNKKEFPLMETSGSCLDIDGLSHGARVTVAGTVLEKPQRITTNFVTTDGGVAMHFDIRIKYGNFKEVIIMNSREAKKVFTLNFSKRIPFTTQFKTQFEGGQDYKLVFDVVGDEFKISNQGEEIGTYKLRDVFSWDTVKQVCVVNDSKNITVTVEKP